MDIPNFTDDIKNIIKSVAASNNLKDYKISSVDKSNKGQGFFSKIFTVTISDNKTRDTKLNLVLKLVFKDVKLQKSMPIRQFFENEIYFYSTIYPTFEEFRKLNNCDQNYDLIPKCYQTRLEPNKESLVLESLKSLEFEIFDKDLDLTVDHLELIFERYGYFHAHSYALKDQNFPKFSEISSTLQNGYEALLQSTGFSEHAKLLCAEINGLLEADKNDKLLNGFRKYVNDFTNVFTGTIDDGGKFSTIIHGDCWTNNMLFKYDKSSGKPLDLRLIDWQLTKIGSPVCDLSYVLYADASKSNLDKLDDYLKVYHKSLSSTLRKLGSDPEKILTFDELKEQWKIYAKFGFIIGFMVVRTKCTASEEMKDFDEFPDPDNRSEAFLSMKFDNKRFETKIRDLVKHMDEIGAL